VKNKELATLFAQGAKRGRSSHMTIEGDRIYSYAACIAIRDEDKFIISNRSKYLGGGTCSRTTSAHIGFVYDACKYEVGIDKLYLVDGWAERGKPEWFIPPPYKSMKGIIQGFASGMCSGWVGSWDRATRTKRIKCEIKDNKLHSGKELIVIREFITSDNRYEVCEICPKRFECLTEKPMFSETHRCPHYLFYIVEQTEYEKLAEKLLQPYRLVGIEDASKL